jgi:arginase
MSKYIQFIFNESELTAGTRGASLGPKAMKIAALNTQSALFQNYPIQVIANNDDALNNLNVKPFAKRIEDFVGVFKQVDHEISHALEQESFPVLISGDHGSAAATIAALQKNYPNKTLGVVWIDAHADLHSPYTTPSGNMHGMPLAIALGEDNLENRRNEPHPETVELWNSLKNYAGTGKIQPEHLVFVGVRDTETPEDNLMVKLKLKNHKVDEVRRKGAKVIARDILKQLDACDLIYVSFDVDSMDPAEVSFGTGTPVKHGLFPIEALDIMEVLVQSEKLCCLEFVEINPCLDNKQNKMAETALSVLEPLVEHIEKLYLKD